MSKKVCDCNCTEGNHDFVIERLYHMREEIDYIIKALEHKNFKEQSQDSLREIEEELTSKSVDIDELLEMIEERKNTPTPLYIPTRNTTRLRTWYY